jgi:hypothetical protein
MKVVPLRDKPSPYFLFAFEMAAIHVLVIIKKDVGQRVPTFLLQF